MIVRFANVVYWLALAVSILLIVTTGAASLLGTITGPIQLTIVVGAVLIWIAGRAVLYVFAGR